MDKITTTDIITDILNNIISNSIQQNSIKQNSKIKLSPNDLQECINWAMCKPPKIIKKTNITIKKQKTINQTKEKEWGNKIIKNNHLEKNSKNSDRLNGQWTTLVGETLVHDILCLKGENPRKPYKKNGFLPDWETDKNIYEVKTSNWFVSGTAGEKVLGTWIKYQDIPIIYKKPLYIVCIANQEYELTNGKTVYFGKNITNKTKKILELAKSWNIYYVPFSELYASTKY